MIRLKDLLDTIGTWCKVWVLDNNMDTLYQGTNDRYLEEYDEYTVESIWINSKYICIQVEEY